MFKYTVIALLLFIGICCIICLCGCADNYVFRILDPAIVSEFKEGPNRAAMCISIVGAIMACTFFLLLTVYFRSERNGD